ncbi:hypothetical protein [Rhizobium sp. BK491]|uniref:hypothetical protein n=1 Tax=Rhizobium sp. BK491 TaxID=2587009 RepID=UPI0016143C07|nr:uncharacterized membrane protein (DUF485 family) [Rhizobium sp. BK491]
MNQEAVRKAVIRHAGAFAAIFAATTALIGIIGWWQGEQWRVTYSNIAILNGVYCILILYLLWIILSHDTPDFLGVPVVKAIHDKKLLIVEGTPWLSLGVMTAIYIKDGEYERLICTGEVVNVQTNRLVQILVRENDDVFGDIDAATEKLAQTAKGAILIRPGLFRRVSQ